MSTTSTAPDQATGEPASPRGTLNVFDPHPLNWLFITWNTMEEPVRTDHEGFTVMALAEDAVWRDELTLAVTVRDGARFQDGEPCTAYSIKENFDEVQRWAAPVRSESASSKMARPHSTPAWGSATYGTADHSPLA